MSERNDKSFDSSQSSVDAAEVSTHFSINGVYPGGAFSFCTQNPKFESSDNQALIESEHKRECEKLARKSYYENHRDFSQRHFEQSCAVDKQLLWLSCAAIGLPVAYLGQTGLSLTSYVTFAILILAWVALLASVFLILKSMDCGNDAFEFNILCLKERYACESEGTAFIMPENKAIDKAKNLSAYAKKLLAIGAISLIFFFTLDIFFQLKNNLIKNEKMIRTDVPTDVLGEDDGR